MISPSAHQARQKMPRHSRWLGAASSVLVSRSRAYGPEAGPVLPVGAPSRSCRCAVGHTASHLLGGVRAETGAIPAMGVFAAAALRAAVPAGGRPSSPGGGSKPSPPWRHQLYALSGPSALSASGRGCYSRQPVGGRCPLSTPRHVDQRPRVTRNRHPRQQVAMPWRALRAVSMRNAGCRALVSASPSLGWIRVHGRMKRWEFRGLRPRCRSEGPHRKDWPAFPRPISPVPADAAARRVPLR